MFIRTFRLLAVMVVLLAGSSIAGEISQGLRDQLDRTDPATPVKVMVFLRDRVDVAALDLQLHLEKAALATRHARVINTLRAHAEATQGPLLAALDADKSAGRVLGYSPHWLVNAVVVTATGDALRDLAARDDVEVIEVDLVPELIKPAAERTAAGDKAVKAIGITPGVVSIGARRVWDELGIRGEGALIGSLDTGVDGTHPALSARWRGVSEPWQECWLDVLGTATTFPNDGNSHGTHTTGTMTGLAPDDTIGVAPAAMWIAGNAIGQDANSGFDNDIIVSFEWFTDPDGDPGTLDDVPDVVQNSWGVNESFEGYVDCDSRWWDVIDACEAAGVVVTWSAGNEGPGSQTLRSPADRATTLSNCFSVGSTITTPPFTISDFSSRGPAGADCGPVENRTKPEIAAPGSDVYSALPGGGYGDKSGTSMAGPHVAGVVALMRSADPDLDVITIKQVLMDTAMDLGDPGEDNTYGHGFLDAYNAVLTVMDGIGYLEGTVTASDTGLPIAGAAVDVVGTPRSTATDDNGQFSLILQQGDHDLSIGAFGFETATASVTIVEDMTLVATYDLVRLPSATVSGTVLDPEGLPAVGAEVSAVGTPVPAALTDEAGFYSLLLPVGDTYLIRALTVGVGIAEAEVVLAGDVTLDLFMEPLSQESFETGDFAAFAWEFGGSAPWQIDGAEAYHGTSSARSGAIGDNQTSTLRMEMDVAEAGDLAFFYRVSSESGYDYLEFWADGARVDRWAGEVGWTEFVHAADVGHHVFEWIYDKDGSVSGGADAGWIDLVTFPVAADPPQITLDPTALAASVPVDGVTTQPLTIANPGEAPLQFMITAQEVATRQKAPQRPTVTAAKGEATRDDGPSPITAQGGPDTFGYRWLDSDDPDGPVFGWVDIAAIGTPLPDYDDETLGPFDLGFTFDFYGQAISQVRICTNGFITFEDTTADPYTNQGIPNAAAPNAMVAVLWDDLNPNTAGTIYHHADTANQRFIVQWDGVAHYGDATSLETCQVIVTSDGEITAQYLTTADDGDCTVGLENPAGDDGLEVLYNSGGYLRDGLAVTYTRRPAVPWISYDPSMGTIPGGGDVEVTVGLDATGLEIGDYSCDLVIGHNAPGQDALVVPVTLTVGSTTAADGLPTAFALYGAAPNPFNPATTIRYSLAAAGHAELKVFDVQGRLVRTLIDGHRAAGPGSVRWDGLDRSGRRVASGTYYARLAATGGTRVEAVVLVK